ncbi:MAG: hypothetical protein AB1813_04150 [Verrucomicrobiota bacterium]|jgi:hypothetical protein
MAENPVVEKLAALARAGTPADEIAIPIYKRRRVYLFKIFGRRKLLAEVEIRVTDVEDLWRIEREVYDYLIAQKQRLRPK